ncbi:MAG: zinc metallopeptidase [Flavobacteriales bacterium]|nr:zinc metallopeptidase [Flavobacteriales bacterium]MCX7767551.1 zinc metallopeptidase [Flavobacteriales bacterium]MDW8410089.1 zinc metallopeptidase [Flavobacteriales bacterium]
MLILIGIFFMVLSLIVGWMLRTRFNHYSEIPLRSGLSGSEVAERMLRHYGIYDVKVVSVPGFLTDHYNPADKTVNLSPEVYHGRSVAAAAVAAHECGHAVQHATAYRWLQMRTTLVPVVQVSTSILNFIFLASMILGLGFQMFNSETMLTIIVVAQAFITLFALITLPVEFDATRRGLAWLNQAGITYGEEHAKAQDALRLAALTYVISALYALANLIYFILRLLHSRD